MQIKTNGVERLSTEPSIISPSPRSQSSGPLRPTEKPLQHAETVDEIMDISSATSSSDEGEISDDSSRRISVERQVLAEFDQSQGNFGPNLMDNILPAQDLNAGRSKSTEDDQMMLAGTPEPADLVSPANEELSRTPDDIQMDESHGMTNTQDQAQVHDEVILDIESDSDYEPPEASSPVDNQAVSIDSEPFSPKSPSPIVQSIPEPQSTLSLASPEITPHQKDNGKPDERDQSPNIKEVCCPISEIELPTNLYLGHPTDFQFQTWPLYPL